MDNVIAIRLDSSDPSALISVLSADGGAYLVVRELEETNPHYHVVLHSKRKHTAIRAALKRAMPELNGNGSYSCVPVRDLDKYVRYCLKGESREKLPDIVAANGMQYATAEWRQAKHDAYWDENDSITRKRSRESVDDVVLHACKDASVQWSNREKISEIYIRELVARNKPINLFSLRSRVNLLQCKLCPDDRAIVDLAAHCVQY